MVADVSCSGAFVLEAVRLVSAVLAATVDSVIVSFAVVFSVLAIKVWSTANFAALSGAANNDSPVFNPWDATCG